MRTVIETTGELLTERPVVQEQVECVKWHRDEANQKVGHGEAQKEVI